MLEISDIHLSLNQSVSEASCLAAAKRVCARRLRCQPRDITSIELRRKSVDARRSHDVHMVATVWLSMGSQADDEVALLNAPERHRRHMRLVEEQRPSFPEPTIASHANRLRPVVVGAGCAGLFAALYLAHAGLEPLLIERGDNATDRKRAIDHFYRTAELDPESNIQFGLGGAGTFSDGKLNTGTKNPDHRLILETFVAAGASRDILWDAKPHIGSDVLPRVVTHIVNEVTRLGGEVRFRCRLTDIERANSGAIRAIRVVQQPTNREAESDGNSEKASCIGARCSGTCHGSLDDADACSGSTGSRTATLACEERIPCSDLILACGHSARDVFELLDRRDISLARKTFAMGVRIEHLQREISRAQYGAAFEHPALGAAPYKLVTRVPSGRNLFSFCMCPGGEVVAAASEVGGVVTNGASEHARAGANANSALLINVTPEDLPGSSVLAGIELQRSCERAAFDLGGGAYRAPAQLLGDFLQGTPSSHGNSVSPTYPLGVTWTALDGTLPSYIIEGLRAGIPHVERKLRGFTAPDAVLTGVETRSSSPVTVQRDTSCTALGVPGLYPCGEGAGYAGGIMSAAADGIRCARALVSHAR